MRYLAILLLAPWLLILCWAYWAYPKSLPRTSGRRIFDFVALLLAMIGATQCAVIGFDMAELPASDQFGRASGGICSSIAAIKSRNRLDLAVWRPSRNPSKSALSNHPKSTKPKGSSASPLGASCNCLIRFHSWAIAVS